MPSVTTHCHPLPYMTEQPKGCCGLYVLWCEEVEECFRVDGRIVCDLCGKPYYKHPLGGPSDQDGNYFPTLHRGCDGKLLKT